MSMNTRSFRCILFVSSLLGALESLAYDDIGNLFVGEDR
jgi:hypothetical protein